MVKGLIEVDVWSAKLISELVGCSVEVALCELEAEQGGIYEALVNLRAAIREGDVEVVR